jgi:SAM-dependent methyltransferase
LRLSALINVSRLSRVSAMQDASAARRHSPSAARNRGPILDVLRRVLPAEGLVLEIASGTGEHVIHFAQHLPGLVWQPSDADADSMASIEAWRAAARLANVRPALALDVLAEPWPVQQADAIVCINMIHISPWTATEALLRGAARTLRPGGVLYLYGPYRRRGRPTAPSNEAFDADLRRRDPEWGLRELEAVADAAARRGLRLRETVDMPANNLSVVITSLGEAVPNS